MQYKVIAVTLLSVTLSAEARSLQGVLSILQKDFTPKVACEAESGLSEADYRQCLTDICGAPDKMKNYEDEMTALADVKPENASDFDPIKSVMTDLLTKRLASQKEYLQSLKARVEANETQIDPAFQSMHKIVELFKLINKIDFEEVTEDASIGKGDYSIVLNQEKLLAELTTMTDGAKAKRLAGPFTELLDNIHLKRLFFGSQLGWAMSNKLLYPGKTLAQVVAIKNAQANKTLVEMKLKQPKLMDAMSGSSFINEKTLKAILTNKNPSEDLLNDFFSAVSMIGIMRDYFISPAPSEFIKFRPENLTDIFSKAELLASLEEKIQAMKDLTVDSPEIQQNIHHCQAIFEKSQLGLPTAAERQAFKGTIAEYKKNFKARIFKRLSGPSSAALLPKFDKVDFDLPASKEDTALLMSEDLKDELLDQIESDKNFLKLKAKNEEKDLLMMTAHEYLGKSVDEINGSLGETCDEYEMESLEDYSLQMGTGKIKVSWLSLKVPDVGRGIISHEMGHALSSLITSTILSKHSAESYKAVRECLNKGFEGSAESEEEIVTWKDTKNHRLKYKVLATTEENYADLIEAKSMLDTDKNSGCFIIKKDSVTKNYKQKETLLEAYYTDTHSSDLFRTLRIEVLRGKTLPESCSSILSEEERAIVTRDCWK